MSGADSTRLVIEVLASFLAFLASGNNLSVNAGAVVGTRALNYVHAVLIALAGYITGLLIQGHLMHIGNTNDLIIITSLLSSISMFVIGEYLGVPMSLVFTLYSVYLGFEVAYMGEALRAFKTVLAWLLIPLLTSLLANAFYQVMIRLARKRPITYIHALQVLTIPSTFLLSFSFGANNLGLLWALTGYSREGLDAIVIGSALGIIVIGWKTLRALSTSLLTISPITGLALQVFSFLAMEVSTLLSIPMSVTITSSFGLVGMGVAHRFKMLNLAYFRRIVIGFLLSIFIGLLIGVLIGLAYSISHARVHH